MSSKEQLDKIININIDLKKVQSNASNQLGIIVTANQEILDSSEIILENVVAHLKDRNIELHCPSALPDGTGLSWSASFLNSKGYDTSKISLEDLLNDKEICAINAEVNRPLIDRLKWDKWDYIVTFGAAVAGSTADFMWGDPSKGLSKYLSDKTTTVGGFFEKIHSMHHTGSPMDYQGFKMGGGDHRLRSIGHDLFGFIQGIWQIKSGTFTGGYFENSKWMKIIADCNQNGIPYDKFSSAEAIWLYTVHVFCDFFSSKSLPVPGFGYLSRLPNREIRKLANDMYAQGYNLRHMFVQALSIAIVEIIIRTYTYLKYHRMEIPQESLRLKQNEMRLLAHGIVTSFNLGKVVITKNPLLLNLPQVLFTCYQFWPLIITHYRRNNRIQIMLRNLNEINDEAELKYMDSISCVLSSEDFGEFLIQKPIIL